MFDPVYSHQRQAVLWYCRHCGAEVDPARPSHPCEPPWRDPLKEHPPVDLVEEVARVARRPLEGRELRRLEACRRCERFERDHCTEQQQLGCDKPLRWAAMLLGKPAGWTCPRWPA